MTSSDPAAPDTSPGPRASTVPEPSADSHPRAAYEDPAAFMRKAQLIAPLLVTVATLLLNVPCLFFPLGRDQGIFAYNTAALLDGAIPYRDFVDQKPPGILFLYAVPLLLLGRNMWGVRVFEWLFAGLTALVVHRLGRRLAGEAAGFLSGLLCGLILSPLVYDFWDRAQIESFLTLPYALVFVLLDGTGRGCWRRALAAGLLGGACFALKPNTAAFPLLAGAVFVWFIWRKRLATGAGAATPRVAPALTAAPPSPLASAAAFLAGFAALPLVLIAWLWKRDALGTFLEHVLSVNAPYVGSGYTQTLLRFLAANIPVIGLLALAIPFLMLKRAAGLRRSLARVVEALGPPEQLGLRLALLAALWVGCVATVLSGRFLFLYHQQVLVLPDTLTAGLGAPILRFMLHERLPVGWLRPRPLASLAILTALLAGALGLRPEDRAFLGGGLSLERYQGSRRFDFYDFSFREDRGLSRAISDFTKPSDRVQIFGHGSLALFLARRRSATRFSFTPAAMDPRYGRGGRDREEILQRLREAPPPLVVITTHDPLPQFQVAPSDEQIRTFPPLAEFLMSGYLPAGRIGDYVLLRRAASAAPSRAGPSSPPDPARPPGTSGSLDSRAPTP